MSIVGTCHLCGRPAMLSCPLCGRVVCNQCLDAGGRVCRMCRRKLDSQLNSDDIMG
ncbi:MAG: orotate phosphoribosyltransferase [Thermoplasmata archaeon]